MKNLRNKIKADLDEDYDPNLDSLSIDDLKKIDEYMSEFGNNRGRLKISSIKNKDNQLDIKLKAGITIFKK